jgi:hypothetical protein
MTSPALTQLKSSASAAPGTDLGLRLALACIALWCNTRNADDVRSVAAAVDWERFPAVLAAHSLAAMVVPQLASTCSDVVPTAVLERLREDVSQKAVANLQQTAELIAILQLFDAKGIRVIPYKGPVLASALYGNLGLRQFSDLDILVAREELPAAEAALLSSGYAPDVALAPGQRRALLRFDCELNFRRGAHYVELHWAVAPYQFGVEFAFESLWARREKLALGGRTVASLSPEDLLLVLSLHAAKHAWNEINWICDVLALVRTREIDWDTVFGRARKLGMERIVAITLALADVVVNGVLPQPVMAWVAADPAVPSFVRSLKRAWEPPQIPLSDWQRHRLLMQVRERWTDRARYAGHLVLTPGLEEWSLVDLPGWLAVLYLPLRLGRIARKILLGPPSSRRPKSH